jgi:excinuclease ABC subunit A
LSIADLLELPVDDAIQFLGAIEGSSAARAIARLRVIQDVGLGYLRLGQPINTLSGGESQRLKLAGHLAEAAGAMPERRRVLTSTELTGPTLFIFDEPTTGLHFEDIRLLLAVFQRLVDRGDSVLIIEHNLDVLKCADWLIDLGPEGGSQGGRVVAAGPPEQVAACEDGYTGRALSEIL